MLSYEKTKLCFIQSSAYRLLLLLQPSIVTLHAEEAERGTICTHLACAQKKDHTTNN
jgi:hypothetical protein